MGKLRDPSHVRAMLLTELRGLFAAAGLLSLRVSGTAWRATWRASSRAPSRCRAMPT